MVNDYDSFSKLRQEALLKGTIKSHKYVEKPMMASMLPDLSNKKVLMLGCGTGEESQILCFDSVELIGVDLSESAIEIAKNSYPQYEFFQADMHQLPFEDNSFDFVYSSLAIHYSPTPELVYQEVNRVLKKGGQLLFSVGHPIRWASEQFHLSNGDTIAITGYADMGNQNRAIYGNYHTFMNHEHLFPDGEILNFYVGSPSFHFKLLRNAGFIIEDFSESKCIESTKEVDVRYYERNSELPQFMAYLCTKER